MPLAITKILPVQDVQCIPCQHSQFLLLLFVTFFCNFLQCHCPSLEDRTSTLGGNWPLESL